MGVEDFLFEYPQPFLITPRRRDDLLSHCIHVRSLYLTSSLWIKSGILGILDMAWYIMVVSLISNSTIPIHGCRKAKGV